MRRNALYGLALCVAVYVAGVELTLINGTYAAIVLAAGALTALAFSAMKGIALSKEKDELDRAAAAYLASLPNDDPDRTRLNDTIELIGPVGFGARIPRRLIGENGLILIILCAISYFGYVHHTANEEALKRIFDATVENTYVLSLSQAERERLNIVMPESLRRKIRERNPSP